MYHSFIFYCYPKLREWCHSGWGEDSRDKSTCCTIMKTWAQIPGLMCKSQPCNPIPLGSRGRGSLTLVGFQVRSRFSEKPWLGKVTEQDIQHPLLDVTLMHCNIRHTYTVPIFHTHIPHTLYIHTYTSTYHHITHVHTYTHAYTMYIHHKIKDPLSLMSNNYFIKWRFHVNVNDFIIIPSQSSFSRNSQGLSSDSEIYSQNHIFAFFSWEGSHFSHSHDINEIRCRTWYCTMLLPYILQKTKKPFWKAGHKSTEHCIQRIYLGQD